MEEKIITPEGKVPELCEDCIHRIGNECIMMDCDVTIESWLRTSNGCNNFEG